MCEFVSHGTFLRKRWGFMRADSGCYGLVIASFYGVLCLSLDSIFLADFDAIASLGFSLGAPRHIVYIFHPCYGSTILLRIPYLQTPLNSEVPRPKILKITNWIFSNHLCRGVMKFSLQKIFLFFEKLLWIFLLKIFFIRIFFLQVIFLLRSFLSRSFFWFPKPSLSIFFFWDKISSC